MNGIKEIIVIQILIKVSLNNFRALLFNSLALISSDNSSDNKIILIFIIIDLNSLILLLIFKKMNISIDNTKLNNKKNISTTILCF